ncbi:MAG: pyridoxal kinase, partial [Alphaproteobacteria bacterium]|nr:pyridoxal kinase [Alphaproteobacteria bacterium]
GYPSVSGPILSPTTVSEVIAGLADRGIFPNCRAILSGYLGSVELGEVVLSTVLKIRKENSHALYCCDPVMGDREKQIYVKDGIPDFFREEIIPHATFLIPNQFELEQLCGHAFHSTKDMVDAARQLIDHGPEIVVVTSVELTDIGDVAAGEILSVYAITKDNAYYVQTPHIPLKYPASGAGDIAAALFLGRYLKSPDVEGALSYMAATIFSLLDHTYGLNQREIALISGQHLIAEPSHRFPVFSI